MCVSGKINFFCQSEKVIRVHRSYREEHRMKVIINRLVHCNPLHFSIFWVFLCSLSINKWAKNIKYLYIWYSGFTCLTRVFIHYLLIIMINIFGKIHLSHLGWTLSTFTHSICFYLFWYVTATNLLAFFRGFPCFLL